MIEQLHTYSIEHNVEDKLRKTIKNLNGYVIKNQASSTTGKGKPDLSACINGHYYGIEVKRDSSQIETTLSQFKNLVAIANAGGYAFYTKTEYMFDAKVINTYKKTIYNLPTSNELKTMLHFLRKKTVKLIEILPTQMIIYESMI